MSGERITDTGYGESTWDDSEIVLNEHVRCHDARSSSDLDSERSDYTRGSATQPVTPVPSVPDRYGTCGFTTNGQDCSVVNEWQLIPSRGADAVCTSTTMWPGVGAADCEYFTGRPGLTGPPGHAHVPMESSGDERAFVGAGEGLEDCGQPDFLTEYLDWEQKLPEREETMCVVDHERSGMTGRLTAVPTSTSDSSWTVTESWLVPTQAEPCRSASSFVRAPTRASVGVGPVYVNSRLSASAVSADQIRSADNRSIDSAASHPSGLQRQFSNSTIPPVPGYGTRFVHSNISQTHFGSVQNVAPCRQLLQGPCEAPNYFPSSVGNVCAPRPLLHIPETPVSTCTYSVHPETPVPSDIPVPPGCSTVLGISPLAIHTTSARRRLMPTNSLLVEAPSDNSSVSNNSGTVRQLLQMSEQLGNLTSAVQTLVANVASRPADNVAGATPPMSEGGAERQERQIGENENRENQANQERYRGRRRRRPRGDPPSDSSDSDGSDHGDDKQDNRRPGRRRSDSIGRSRYSSSGRSDQRSSRFRPIKLEKFDGTSVPVTTFLHKYDNCVRYNRWSDDDKVSHLRDSLHGPAAQLLWELPDDASAADILSAIKNRFGSDSMREKFRAELANRRRRPGETAQEIYVDIRRLMALGYPGEKGEVYDTLGRDAFLTALRNDSLRLRVLDRSPANLDETLALVLRMEAYTVDPDHTESKDCVSASCKVAQVATNQSEEVSELTKMVAKIQQSVDSQQAELKKLSEQKSSPVGHASGGRTADRSLSGHRNKDRRSDNSRKSGQSNSVYCIACVEQTDCFEDGCLCPFCSGHVRGSNNPPGGNRRGGDGGSYRGRGGYGNRRFKVDSDTCYLCHKRGHWKRNCPTRNAAVNSQGVTVATGQQPGQQFTIPAGNLFALNPGTWMGGPPVNARPATGNSTVGPVVFPLPVGNAPVQAASARSASAASSVNVVLGPMRSSAYVDIKVKGKDVPALLDTGADSNICPLRLCKNAKLSPTSAKLHAANGTEIEVAGVTRLKFHLNGKEMHADVIVSPMMHDLIFGFPFLEKNKCRWLFDEGRVIIDGVTVELNSRPCTGAVRRCEVREPVMIPADTGAAVPVRLLHLDRYTRPGNWVSESSSVRKGLLVARTLLSDNSEYSSLALLNLSDKDQSLRAGEGLCDVELGDDVIVSASDLTNVVLTDGPVSDDPVIVNNNAIDTGVDPDGPAIQNDFLLEHSSCVSPTSLVAETAHVSAQNQGKSRDTGPTVAQQVDAVSPAVGVEKDITTQGTSRKLFRACMSSDHGEFIVDFVDQECVDRRHTLLFPLTAEDGHFTGQPTASYVNNANGQCLMRPSSCVCSNNMGLAHVHTLSTLPAFCGPGEGCPAVLKASDLMRSEDSTRRFGTTMCTFPADVFGARRVGDQSVGEGHGRGRNLNDYGPGPVGPGPHGNVSHVSANLDCFDVSNGNVRPLDRTVSVVSAAEPAAFVDSTHLQPIIDGLSPSLSAEQRDSVAHLLERNASVFSRSAWDIGCCNLFQASINTGDHAPIAEPLRRHARAYLDVIDQTVNDMVKAGVVETASSPWSFNLVVVAKKDDVTGAPQKPRITVDFRKLNAITYKDKFPLPNVKDCLQSLENVAWLSSLDLSHGFYQVGVKEEDRDKLSFLTRQGQWRLTRLGMGCSNSPSVFCRLMAMALRGLKCILAYLDDCLIFSSSFEDHVRDLQSVFDRFKAVNMKLKPNKCRLFQTSTKFLGHVVSNKGIEVDTDKVACIKAWPFPKTVSELRSFLGTCTYYRQFVRNFSAIAEPLNQMLRKDVAFERTPKREEAFEKLKEALVSAPILATPLEDPSCTFYVDVDASSFGLGAVLSQMQHGTLKVIEYASRSLSNAERNYCATKREMTGFIFALKQFRTFLLGQKFVVRVDNAAVSYFRSMKDVSGQVGRYLEFLADFDLEIQHRAGKVHANADGISRIPPCDVANGEPCAQCLRRFNGKHSANAVKVVNTRRTNHRDDSVSHVDKPSGTAGAPVSAAPDAVSPAVQVPGPGTSVAADAGLLTFSAPFSGPPGESGLPAVGGPTSASDPSSFLEADANTADNANYVAPRAVQRKSFRRRRRPARFDDTASCKDSNPLADSGFSSSQGRTPGDDSPRESNGSSAFRDQRRRATTRPPADFFKETGSNGINGVTDDQIREAQRSDATLGQVMTWIDGQTRPDWTSVQHSSPALRAMWKQWDSLTLLNGLLYRSFCDNQGSYKFSQLVLPNALKVSVLRQIHEDVAGHLKYDKCVPHLQRRVWWYNWKRDLRTFITCCQKCESFIRGKPPKQSFLTHTHSGAPGERWAIDLVGPVPKSKGGYRYILTCICVFTKFSVFVPLRDKEALTVAKALFKHVFTRFAFCFEILSDQGTEFDNALMKCLCDLFHIKKLRTSAYRPQANPICEASHRSLHSLVAKCVEASQRDWCELLPYCELVYNSAEHSSHGFSPFFLMHGREPIWPIDIALPDVSQEQRTVPEFVVLVNERIDKAQEAARQALRKTAEYTAHWYSSKGVKPREFHEGEEVRVYIPKRKPGLTHKWQKFFETTGRIVKKINDSAYLVYAKKFKGTKVLHVDKLKRVQRFELPGN